MKIYLDMDDVVADWHASAQEFLRMKWNKDSERIPQEDWDKLKIDSRFYLNLPLKENAQDLVNWCRTYHAKTACGLAFLSALPRNNDMQYASYDKVLWAQQHFPGIPVFIGPYSNDKWRHCQLGDILIDDRTSNCTEWENAGGRAHIYKNWPECKVWLESTLNVQMQSQ